MIIWLFLLIYFVLVMFHTRNETRRKKEIEFNQILKKNRLRLYSDEPYPSNPPYPE